MNISIPYHYQLQLCAIFIQGQVIWLSSPALRIRASIKRQKMIHNPNLHLPFSHIEVNSHLVTIHQLWRYLNQNIKQWLDANRWHFANWKQQMKQYKIQSRIRWKHSNQILSFVTKTINYSIKTPNFSFHNSIIKFNSTKSNTIFY